ncbi:olfactomedin-4-like isoform X1 [Panthera pardus]|uniref:Olfactomedin-4-like isoform X1 n=1 Tax=Panthera pardus TaxID=9691 RepID=A0A9W2VBK8_PANPR|nr:olfactomedin-4-like isoform X1 [Panthera pardus]XP_060461795.1 olfactomedin-4-like isoform X1 [Panthera onca]
MQSSLALLITILLLPLALPGRAQSLREESTPSSVNCSQTQSVHELVPGSMGKDGLCHCVVHLANDLIPLKKLEQLQSTAQELMDKYDQELLRVANASLILKLLADSDQHDLCALRQEVDSLKDQLRECEREKEEVASGHSGPPLPPGSCDHGGLQKVSRPFVVQLNWRGFAHKAGTWGRDSAPSPDSSLYWVAPMTTDSRYFDYYQMYKSYDDLVLMKNYEKRSFGYGDGSGNTVYKNFMYFNYYGTRDIAKLNLSSNTLVLRRPLPSATYNNRFSYVGVPWKDLDFAGDEKGLWVLYATEESKGNLLVSRLNTSTLEVEKTWQTNQYKPAMSGAFMACGVLYALRPRSTHQEEIFYAFDTNTGRERHLSILLDKMLETLHGINYSPLDHKLYVYNDGYLINYDLGFQMLKHKPSKLPAEKFSWFPIAPKSVKPNKTSSP